MALSQVCYRLFSSHAHSSSKKTTPINDDTFLFILWKAKQALRKQRKVPGYVLELISTAQLAQLPADLGPHVVFCLL